MKLNGDIPVEIRRHNASSKSLSNADRITVSINVEFLDSCDFHCPGCFVKRRNSFTDNDLDVLNNLAQQFDELNVEVNEIILGPTDVFGCKNAEEVLTNTKFISLFDHFHALTFNSTLQTDPERVQHFMDIIKEKYPEDMYLEAFVVLDIDKFITKDEEYLATFERNLEIINEANIIFAFNIHNKGIFKNVDFGSLSKEINERYNSHLKMVPSFFRSQKTSIILDNLWSWRDELEQNLDETNSNAILYNMSDLHFGGFTYFIYTFKNGELYINPCIYDFTFEQHPSLLVPANDDGFYDLKKVFDFEVKNTNSQYRFAKHTTECEGCRYLTSCVSKNVLSFMKNRGIMDCFLSKKTMDYNNKVPLDGTNS